ncbi:acrEF/envCD operon transcriptional regulator, partial [Escherichia coli]|nr:acrEF/envCD operon transcriptional regulator [Escherichia coli]
GQISATLNINVAIILLQSCLNGIISDWLSQPDSFNLFSLVDILVDNMLKMILAEPQQKQTEQSRRHRSVNQAYI